MISNQVFYHFIKIFSYWPKRNSILKKYCLFEKNMFIILSNGYKPSLKQQTNFQNNMTVMVIDTLQFSKRMQNAGLNQKIAEELAEAIKDSTSISTENIATKQDLLAAQKDIEVINKDIKAVETNLRKEFNVNETNLRQEINIVRQEIKMSEQRMIIKIGAMITMSVAVIAWLNSVIH
jgi:septal ring factor EnvC (AmiA/AmiB activator)